MCGNPSGVRDHSFALEPNAVPVATVSREVIFGSLKPVDRVALCACQWSAAGAGVHVERTVNGASVLVSNPSRGRKLAESLMALVLHGETPSSSPLILPSAVVAKRHSGSVTRMALCARAG
jgi:hypothetical protein